MQEPYGSANSNTVPEMKLMPSVPPAYNEADMHAPMQGYPSPASYGQPNMIVVSQPTYEPGVAGTRCWKCSSNVVPVTTTKASCLAHLCCCIMFFTALWPCCLIPYCMHSCETTVQRCPNCRRIVGKY